LGDLETRGIDVPFRHAANSPGILFYSEIHFDLVRLGIAMHGLDPSPEKPLPPGFRPVMTLKTMVSQVQELPPESPVSYGGTYVTRGHERIAVLPIGYADGFRRKPHNWGEVLVRGQRAPIVGRVCMDHPRRETRRRGRAHRRAGRRTDSGRRCRRESGHKQLRNRVDGHGPRAARLCRRALAQFPNQFTLSLDGHI
jgi:alanine racemase